MKVHIKEILRLTYIKTKKGLPWAIGLAIAVSVGQFVGKYKWDHSQENKVFLVQDDLLKALKTYDLPKDLNKHELDLIFGAKNTQLCKQTILNQSNELISSVESLDNSCSQPVTYDNVMSKKTFVNPADIIEKYLPILQENCK